jgi:hypothetical protein
MNTTKKIDATRRIAKSILLPNGDEIVVLYYFDALKKHSEEEICKNLYRIKNDRSIVWRIADYGQERCSTFVNIYFIGDDLFAYNFDGFEYLIDINNGTAKAHQLLK